MQVAPIYGESSGELTLTIIKAFINLSALRIIFSLVFPDISDLREQLIRISSHIVKFSFPEDFFSSRTGRPISEHSPVRYLLDPDRASFGVHLFNRVGDSPNDPGKRVGLWGMTIAGLQILFFINRIRIHETGKPEYDLR